MIASGIRIATAGGTASSAMGARPALLSARQTRRECAGADMQCRRDQERDRRASDMEGGHGNDAAGDTGHGPCARKAGVRGDELGGLPDDRRDVRPFRSGVDAPEHEHAKRCRVHEDAEGADRKHAGQTGAGPAGEGERLRRCADVAVGELPDEGDRHRERRQRQEEIERDAVAGAVG